MHTRGAAASRRVEPPTHKTPASRAYQRGAAYPPRTQQPARNPQPGRSRSAARTYGQPPAKRRQTAPTIKPTRGQSQRRPAPRRARQANGAAVVFCACVALLAVMFIISNSIGKNAANRAMIDATAPPSTAAGPTAIPAPTEEPTAAPLVVYRNQPESTPYVSDELIRTIEEIQSARVGQEGIEAAPPDNYVTISDEPVIDESGRAGQPGDPVAVPLLVNAANPLPPEWYPDDMVYLNEYCPSEIVRVKALEIQGSKAAVDALLEMLTDAIAQGQTNWQVSAGYRSYNYQQSLFGERVAGYMKENGMSRSDATSAAARFVASPGASEHHTGLAFDITIPGWTFEATEQCKWLAEHCADYGFIVRYTKDKVKLTGIEAEPWHIRYVGKEHARAITDAGLCLEEYVELLQSRN